MTCGDNTLFVTGGWPMSWPTTISENATDPAVPGPKSTNKELGSRTKNYKGLRQVKRAAKEQQQKYD